MAHGFYPFKCFRTEQRRGFFRLNRAVCSAAKNYRDVFIFYASKFSSASTGKSMASLGVLRVTSSTTIATLLSALAISLKRFDPTGWGLLALAQPQPSHPMHLGVPQARLCQGGFGLELGCTRRFFRREAKHQP